MDNKYNTWKCETCGEIFKEKQLLYNHYEQYNNHHKLKPTSNKTELKKCKYCNKEWLTTNPGLLLHEKSCKCNPNRIDGINKGHKMKEEDKLHLSLIMKEKHKLGLACTLSDLRRKEKPSYPEQWLIDVIKNENLNNNYIREYKFHTFSLDFVWLQDKKVIEMDGRFHKISEYQKDCDQRKDKLLKEEGWKELRIDWEYCMKNTQEVLKQIKQFIGE